MVKNLAILSVFLAFIALYGCGDAGTSVDYLTLVVQPGETGKDATIIDDVGPSDHNHGHIKWLMLIEGESGYIGPVKSNVLIQWDLSEIPTNAVVVDAQMWLFVKFAEISGRGDEHFEDAVGDLVYLLVTDDWEEDKVTWDDRPSVDEGSKVVCGKPPAGTDWRRRWWSADVTDFVRAWHDGVVPNHGLCIRLDGTDLGDLGYYNAEFPSSEAFLEPGGDPKTNCIWPKLVITYTVG